MEQDFNSRILYVVSPGWGTDDASGFSKVVNILEEFSYNAFMVVPGEAAMLSSSAVSYFKSETNLVKQITDKLTALLHRPINIGISNGLFAAKLAALHNAIVQKDKLKDFLSPLSVMFLPDRQISDFLLKLGVKTLGEFANIKDSLVLERLGLSGKWCHGLASGNATDLPAKQQQKVFSEYIVFEPPSFSYEQIFFRINKLSEAFIDSITKHGLLVISIQIKIEFETLKTFEKTWYSSLLFTKKNLTDRLRWTLELLQPESAVEKIEFIALDTVSNGSFQDNFFSTTVQNDIAKNDIKLTKVLDHLEILLGSSNVYKPSIGPSRYPDCTIEKIPRSLRTQIPYLKDTPATDKADIHKPENLAFGTFTSQELFYPIDKLLRPWPSSIPAFYPSIFYEKPITIKVVNRLGHDILISSKAIISDIPYFILSYGFKKKISDTFGPWPITEYWWNRSKLKRLAYLQLITDDQIALLVYSLKQKWYLVGIYD